MASRIKLRIGPLRNVCLLSLSVALLGTCHVVLFIYAFQMYIGTPHEEISHLPVLCLSLFASISYALFVFYMREDYKNPAKRAFFLTLTGRTDGDTFEVSGVLAKD